MKHLSYLAGGEENVAAAVPGGVGSAPCVGIHGPDTVPQGWLSQGVGCVQGLSWAPVPLRSAVCVWGRMGLWRVQGRPESLPASHTGTTLLLVRGRV